VSGEIDLPPASLSPQLPDSFAEQDANIRCHPAIMKLSFRVNLSYAISGGHGMGASSIPSDFRFILPNGVVL
jgi:hypothetical protein